MTAFLIIGSLGFVALWELLWPRRTRRFSAMRRRFGNISIWLGSTFAVAVLLPETSYRPFGWYTFAIEFLLLDLLGYINHRILHAVPFLWRIHAMHHSDPDVDWSTALRHHPFELLLTNGSYWIAVVLLGIPTATVTAHTLVSFALAVATHGNVTWPVWAERCSPFLVTLDTHLVHHSITGSETNFGAMLSVWDRLFGTYHAAAAEPVFGIQGVNPEHACKPREMLLTPWRITNVY